MGGNHGQSKSQHEENRDQPHSQFGSMIHGMSAEHIFTGATESRSESTAFRGLDQDQNHQNDRNNHDQRINNHIES